jgi:hypothetical protein
VGESVIGGELDVIVPVESLSARQLWGLSGEVFVDHEIYDP